MEELKNIPSMANRFPKLLELLDKYDLIDLENRMGEIQTEDDLPKAVAISKELDNILKVVENYMNSNGKSKRLKDIYNTIKLQKNLFETRCRRTIVITKFS